MDKETYECGLCNCIKNGKIDIQEHTYDQFLATSSVAIVTQPTDKMLQFLAAIRSSRSDHVAQFVSSSVRSRDGPTWVWPIFENRYRYRL